MAACRFTGARRADREPNHVCNHDIIAPYKRSLGRLPTVRWCNVAVVACKVANATLNAQRTFWHNPDLPRSPLSRRYQGHS